MAARVLRPWSNGWSDGFGPVLRLLKIPVYKVFDSSRNYLGTWQDVVNMPTFKSAVNDGPGAMVLQLARAWNHLGEQGDATGRHDMMLGNIVQVWIVDVESGQDGLLLFEGRIRYYDVDLAGKVEVTLAPQTVVASDRYLAEDEAIDFLGADPTDIAHYLVTNGFLAGVGWNSANPLVGRSIITQQVGKGYVKDVLTLTQRFAGGSWYWRIDVDESQSPSPWSLTFNASSLETADHTLTIGKHVMDSVHLIRSELDRHLRVTVTGADILDLDGNTIGIITAQAVAPGYDPTDDPRDFAYGNKQITDPGTARQVANALLEFYNTYFVDLSPVRVIDSNFDPDNGYDIESLKPGQTVRLIHPENQPYFHFVGDHIIGDGHVIGGDWYAQAFRTIRIAEMNYQYTYVDLTLQLRPARMVDELVNLATRLLIEETA